MAERTRRNRQANGSTLDRTTPASLRLLAGSLCLDFANTVDPRLGPERRDRLRAYSDLVVWGRHAGVLSVDQLLLLLAEAEERPDTAAAILASAVELREAIYRVFLAVARGGPPPPPDLETIRRVHVGAMRQTRLVPAGDRFALDWRDDGAELGRILWPVARSAVELLTAGDLARLKECPGAGDCGWLFLDASKNGTRRWCSMEGCGSRVKMRRRYARRNAAGAPERDAAAAPIDPGSIGFRPLRTTDVPLLRRWLTTEHVHRWWDPEVEWTEAAVGAEYAQSIAGQEPTVCFVVTHGGADVGFVQTYRWADYPDHARRLGVDDEAAGLDLFIGEPGFVHRGLGPHILRRFLRQIVFAGSPPPVACWIDPDPANAAAIRAYEKVGFRHVRTVAPPDQGTPAYVMRVGHEELAPDAAPR